MGGKCSKEPVAERIRRPEHPHRSHSMMKGKTAVASKRE